MSETKQSARSNRERRFRRFLVTQAVIVLSAIAVLVSWNLLIDPYGGYGLVELDGIEDHRGTNGTRRTKAEALRRGGYETVLLGSSVVATGFDPSSRALDGSRTYNLGLAGSALLEQAGALRMALAAEPPPRRVLFFIDFELFDRTRIPRSVYVQSPLNPRYGVFEYHASNLLGAQATEHSAQALRNWTKEKTPNYDAAGHRFTPVRREGTPWRRMFTRELELLGAAAQINYAEDRFVLLARMIRSCRARGTELLLVIPPAHGLRLELRQRQHPTAWEDWKRELVRLVETENANPSTAGPVRLFDFAVHCEPAEETVPQPGDTTTTLEHFWDGLHFQTGLGDQVLARMLGTESLLTKDPPPDLPASFGRELYSANIESHLEEDSAARELYLVRLRQSGFLPD